MSVLKPVMKQPRVPALNMTKLARTASTNLPESAVVKDHPTVSHPSSQLATAMETTTTTTPSKVVQTPAHPKGHKVRTLSEVWKNMDSQSFLHLSDTLTLGDVWVIPTSAEPESATIANVTFRQMVAAPHIKRRLCSCKMSTDDLLKILYLNECMQWDLQGITRVDYDAWINEKSALCVKAKGLDEGSNRAKLCNFIMTEDDSFTFYPRFLKGRCGIFFRKICYHSYKSDDMKVYGYKLNNPSMIKCCATRGKFEYVLEARIFPLPEKWFEIDPITSAPEEIPDSQLLV